MLKVYFPSDARILSSSLCYPFFIVFANAIICVFCNIYIGNIWCCLFELNVIQAYLLFMSFS